jgi:hypothetical protein
MAQPVINIRFPGPSQDDALSPQCGQRRQREPIQHDTEDYVGVVSSGRPAARLLPGSALQKLRGPGDSLASGLAALQAPIGLLGEGQCARP